MWAFNAKKILKFVRHETKISEKLNCPDDEKKNITMDDLCP